MKRTGAEIITALLERQGVTTVAGIPGGANLPLYDALRSSSIRHILARHEQGAGFMAQGMARVTGRAAVCLATSGPGATNLLTAIADAKLDSVPLVAITGQVPVGLIGTDAFQEVDTYGLTLPITKHNFIARSAAELLDIIPEAFAIAETGRPGPVVVDVPKDVQLQETEFDAWPEPGGALPAAPADAPDVERLADMIRRAERPVLYAGGGVVAAGAADSLACLARRNGIPVALTLNGLGAFPADDPLCLGMLGMHGARHTNMILDRADLLVAAGVRFDDRATGRVSHFCEHAVVAHIDIDPSEVGKIRAANLGICGDVGEVLRVAAPMLPEDGRAAWNEEIDSLRAEGPPDANGDPGHPPAVIRAVAKLAGPDAIVTTDVGQHQMWVAQAYPFRRPRRFLTSAGLGTMGFGLPAAIGAALAEPGTRVVCFSGDGSFLMNIQELATLADLQLDVTVLVMDNQHLGLVRQQQELFYDGRYFASRFDTAPDFTAIARGFGLPAATLDPSADPVEALRDALDTPGPAVLTLPIDAAHNVFPIVPPGAANIEMIEGDRAYA